ncbi:MAG: tocopherol cyclase family protein, partial [Caldilineaceae bacterium]
GVLSFDHALTGQLIVDGSPVDFHGGRGYIEKDWGQAFPQAWIWMQSNHFGAPGTCLTASVARIPWMGSAFRGFIVGLWHDGQLFRFATYTGATIETLQVSEQAVHWVLRGGERLRGMRHPLRLEIVARRSTERTELLHAPYRTAMLQRVLESLTATVEVRLSDESHGRSRVLFEGTGACAGLELGGDLSQIL